MLELYKSFHELLEAGIDGVSNIGNPKANSRPETVSKILYMANCILIAIAAISRTSGVNCLLTIPLVIAGSTLQRATQKLPEPSQETDSWSKLAAETLSIHSQDGVIFYWRDFVKERIEAVHCYVGVPAIPHALDIIQKVWTRSDIRAAVYEPSTKPSYTEFILWTDVTAEERLEAILG